MTSLANSFPLRVIVADDEAPARRKLLRLLRDESNVEVVAEADGGQEALTAITKHRPDLIFLDVQMPRMDGFSVAETLAASQAHTPSIIFVTAHDQFALRAFEVHAFDYLLKPVNEERFRASLHRVRQQIAQSTNNFADRLNSMFEQLRKEKSFPERLLIHEDDRARFVPVNDILWIEADRNYLLIHCAKKTYTLRSTLEALQDSLDPKLFVRLNRGSLVRLAAIREMLPWFHGEYKVFLHDNTELRWSRRFVTQRPELLKPS